MVGSCLGCGKGLVGKQRVWCSQACRRHRVRALYREARARGLGSLAADLEAHRRVRAESRAAAEGRPGPARRVRNDPAP
jgi:hypothetical protein